MTQPEDDRIVTRKELRETIKRSDETIRLWIKKGELPKPTVRLGTAQGWRLSALRKHGVDWV